MAERGAGQRSWPLSPYEVNVSFARTNAAGEEANWFGPLTPITPLAPPEVAGRQWDYPAGYNLSTLSRPFEPITFSTLRALADGYDLLRLAAVTGNPAAGQYAVASGVYSFAQPDAGSTVLLTYGYVPADLASCCMDWAAERYAYRSRIGQHSKSLGGQETMAFIVKDIPDFVVSALASYRRVVMP